MAGIGRKIGGISFGVSMDTSRLNSSAGKARRTIAGFVGQTTRMLGVLGGTAGAVALVAKAGKSFENLNRSMNRSLAIMGNVSDKMRGDMTKAAIEVARVTKFSASQAADAYFFLASAGLNAEQSLAAMPKVAEFATAGNFDLATATDLVTDAQSALGLASKDAGENLANMGRVMDVFVKGNTLANSSVEQLALAMTTGAGAALKTVGKDIEEGAALLLAFADQGIKGAEAGTAFGIVMRDLQTKSIINANAFKRVGLAVFDSSGEMRNLGDIVSDLEKKMVGLSDQAKKTFLLDLGFSDKSVKFVQTLLGTSDKIKDYEMALRSAGGTTADVASKMLTPLEKAMNQLKGAFDDAAQAMGPLVSKAAELLQYTAGIVNAVNSSNAPGSTKGGDFDSLMQSIGFKRTGPGKSPLARGINAFDEIVRGFMLGSDTTDYTPSPNSAVNRKYAAAHNPPTPFAPVPDGTGERFGEAPGKALADAGFKAVTNTLKGAANYFTTTRDSLLTNITKLHFKLSTGQLGVPPDSKEKTRSLSDFNASQSGSLAAYQQRIRGEQQFGKAKIEQQQLDVQMKMSGYLESLAKNLPALESLGAS